MKNKPTPERGELLTRWDCPICAEENIEEGDMNGKVATCTGRLADTESGWCKHVVRLET